MKKWLILTFGALYILLTFYAQAAADTISSKIQALRLKKVAPKDRGGTVRVAQTGGQATATASHTVAASSPPEKPKVPVALVVKQDLPVPASQLQPTTYNLPPSSIPEPHSSSTVAVIVVSNFAELAAVLGEVKKGETVSLRAGDYGGRIENVHPPLKVTINSADPATKARITSLDLRSVSNLTFDNLRFEFVGVPTQYQYDIRIAGSDNISFSHSVFKGTATGYAATVAETVQNLFDVEGSSNISVEHSEISHFMHGIGMTKTENILIKGNDIHHMQGDGARFAGVNHVRIEGNRMHDFFGSEVAVNHADFIQFWTTGTEAPSADIVIKANILESASPVQQAIFLRDERGDSGQEGTRFQNVLIEDNIVATAHPHGITILNGDNLIIRRNKVTSGPAAFWPTAINIQKGTKVEVYENNSPKINIDKESEVVRNEANTII